MVSLWILMCAITSSMAIEKLQSGMRGISVPWTGYQEFHWPAFQKGLNNLKQIWLMVGLWMFINRRRSSVCNRVEWLGPIGHAFDHWPFLGNFPKPSIGFHEHFLQIRIIYALPARWSKFIYLPTNISVCIFLQFLFVPGSKAPIVQELVEVEGLPNNTRFVHIAAGDYHSAAVSGSHFS